LALPRGVGAPDSDYWACPRAGAILAPPVRVFFGPEHKFHVDHILEDILGPPVEMLLPPPSSRGAGNGGGQEEGSTPLLQEAGESVDGLT
jgi:hypothetical protein